MCWRPRPRRNLGPEEAAANAEAEKVGIEAAGQQFLQTKNFIYLGRYINEDADTTAEIERRTRAAYSKLKKYNDALFSNKAGPALRMKISLLKSEVIETLLYGCDTWTLSQEDYSLLRRIHHYELLRCIGFDHKLSSVKAQPRCKYQSIETTIRKRRLIHAGKMVRITGTRLPKMMLFGELRDGTGRRRGQEKSWHRCQKENLARFDIPENGWLVSAESATNWCKTVETGAFVAEETFIAAEKKDNAARHSKRAAESAAAVAVNSD